jgi:hypothetical protein
MIRLPHVIGRLDIPNQAPRILGWEARHILGSRANAFCNGAISLSFRGTDHLVYRGSKNRYSDNSDVQTNVLVHLMVDLIPEIEQDIHPDMVVFRPRTALILDAMIEHHPVITFL